MTCLSEFVGLPAPETLPDHQPTKQLWFQQLVDELQQLVTAGITIEVAVWRDSTKVEREALVRAREQVMDAAIQSFVEHLAERLESVIDMPEGWEAQAERMVKQMTEVPA